MIFGKFGEDFLEQLIYRDAFLVILPKHCRKRFYPVVLNDHLNERRSYGGEVARLPPSKSVANQSTGPTAIVCTWSPEVGRLSMPSLIISIIIRGSSMGAEVLGPEEAWFWDILAVL